MARSGRALTGELPGRPSFHHGCNFQHHDQLRRRDMQPTPTRNTAALKASFALLLLLLSVAGHGAMALAQSPGTFSATGHMITPRFLHTATLLLDGRVLIA